jgi:hypothetical protein
MKRGSPYVFQPKPYGETKKLTLLNNPTRLKNNEKRLAPYVFNENPTFWVRRKPPYSTKHLSPQKPPTEARTLRFST